MSVHVNAVLHGSTLMISRFVYLESGVWAEKGCHPPVFLSSGAERSN